MAKVLACVYRYVEVVDAEKGIAKRHVYRPGEKPDGLSKEVVEDLDKRGLLVDEKRFSKELGVVLPPAEALKRYEEDSAEDNDDNAKAPAKKATSSSDS